MKKLRQKLALGLIGDEVGREEREKERLSEREACTADSAQLCNFGTQMSDNADGRRSTTTEVRLLVSIAN